MNSEIMFRLCTLLPMAFTALFGIIITIYSFFKIRTIKKFQTPFGFLMQAFFSNIFLYFFVILIWLLLRIFLNINTFIENSSHYFGSVMIFSWYFIQMITVTISINRFIAISIPIYYRLHFTIEMTKISVGIIFCITIFLSIISLIDNCGMKFSTITLTWHYPKTVCGRIYSYWLQFIGSLCILLINLMFDILTLILLIYRKKHSILPLPKLEKSATIKTSCCFRQDVLFFCQSFLQNINALLIVISINFFTKLIKSLYGKFYFTTFAWFLSYVMDVVIVIVFNKELRKI
ncbi:GPCR, rhodopsin-like, 7TM domain and 7TM GPCR,serpentine receptor class x (Srx) family-containing protein [Strongyloides ratti]|uniref:GPCR, rhodopsin-like, 7TM domain and 7TM GPCR,serpentine receptor class x (Srx) family-containing protein n=1 Tax=Strongyloides ratti TaxID=34506 RepID=A0A090L004_STRRB|nr:GPCR, rhodopsin-like, 7TM domain and 7TM GPCR,serpentine receptor class x (Srx) family-containing protein [Strongyloides ratti]CEF60789.1 GPCR, rhodopsin-like, 7TM domain and 7TM GPCR,serpentine receptor class x (Srx) family-containing protein [Strongyloides ratti]